MAVNCNIDEFPLFRHHKRLGLTVMFTAPELITVLVQGSYHRKVGEVLNDIVPHTNSMWTPCEDPRVSKTNKMLRRIKDV